MLDQYSKKLVTSGFPKVMIAKIVRNGILAYQKAVARHNSRKRDINEPGEIGMYLRRLGKIVDKGEWYRKEREEEDSDGRLTDTRWYGSFKRDRKQARNVNMNGVQVRIGAVIFVPQTPGGELAKLLRDKIDSMAPSLGWKYRVVEKAGATIKSRVCRSNPWTDNNKSDTPLT